MLKMALLDCAINEKYCSVDGGRGICPLFSPHPRADFWALAFFGLGWQILGGRDS